MAMTETPAHVPKLKPFKKQSKKAPRKMAKKKKRKKMRLMKKNQILNENQPWRQRSR